MMPLTTTAKEKKRLSPPLIGQKLDFGSQKIKRKGFKLLSVDIDSNSSPKKSPTKSIKQSIQLSQLGMDQVVPNAFDIKDFIGL